MMFSEWLQEKLKFSAGRSKTLPVDQRCRVFNLTRKTTLASQLEVADHGETRRQGLLGRSSLPDGGGLWIKPCESVHTIGMQFPIDLIYLDRSHRIKKTRCDVGPWRISACLTAHSVLELPSGTIQGTQTQPGDMLLISPVPEVDNHWLAERLEIQESVPVRS